jgi:hypothetical protein
MILTPFDRPIDWRHPPAPDLRAERRSGAGLHFLAAIRRRTGTYSG